eukprot:scaffold4849_cov153-Amphora_coffeaeformis.AAC.9
MATTKYQSFPSHFCVKKAVEKNADPTETTDRSEDSLFIEECTSMDQLVNHARSAENLKPLKRDKALDNLAQRIANLLGKTDDPSACLVDPKQLQRVLKSGFVAQNIEVGKTVLDMHEASMKKGSNSNKMILSKDYRYMGYATAQSKSAPSFTYCVQLFRGKRNGCK